MGEMLGPFVGIGRGEKFTEKVGAIMASGAAEMGAGGRVSLRSSGGGGEGVLVP